MAEKLILDFYNNWDIEFANLKKALISIKETENQLHLFEFKSIVDAKDLDNHHCSWLHLMSKYQGLEKDFFKMYFVPIEKEIYNYYVDLSDENLPVFELYYFGLMEKGRYYGIKLFNSIYDILDLGSLESIKERYEIYKEDRFFLRNRI
jgi:hypothetical protein